MKNKKMIKLRVDYNLTQEAAADAMDVSPATYRQVEAGLRTGSHSFWVKFQAAFMIPKSEMWEYQEGGGE